MLACGGSVTGVEAYGLRFFMRILEGSGMFVREYAAHLRIYSSKHLNGLISYFVYFISKTVFLHLFHDPMWGGCISENDHDGLATKFV